MWEIWCERVLATEPIIYKEVHFQDIGNERMLRYEFSEGTSNKFWEIKREGSVVTTRWGRIGTTGQSKSKDHGSTVHAMKEYEKLISSKEKKGYVLSKLNKDKQKAKKIEEQPTVAKDERQNSSDRFLELIGDLELD